jgi:hypothetical protein
VVALMRSGTSGTRIFNQIFGPVDERLTTLSPSPG